MCHTHIYTQLEFINEFFILHIINILQHIKEEGKVCWLFLRVNEVGGGGGGGREKVVYLEVSILVDAATGVTNKLDAVDVDGISIFGGDVECGRDGEIECADDGDGIFVLD